MTTGAPPAPPTALVLLLANQRLKRDPLLRYGWPGEPHRRAARYHAQGIETLLRGSNDAAKPQPVDEPVLTPTGFRPIGSLAVGDEVIGGDGRPHRVVGVHPQGVRDVFRLSFGDGSWTRCTDDHLWRAKLPGRRFSRPGEWSVVPLATIRARCGDRPSSPIRRAVVPTVRPVAFESKPAPLDPYLLGLLLGDGALRQSPVITSADPELIDIARRLVPAGIVIRQSRHVSRAPSYTISTGVVGGDLSVRPKNRVREALVELGLAGLRSHEKFVPKLYLYNSIEARLGVLQGLMDTDGTVSRTGAPSFTSTSRRMAKNVVWLARSLGGRASLTHKRTFFRYLGSRKEGKRAYQVHLRLPDFPLFRLKRKLERTRPGINTTNRVLWSVVPDGRAECVCIAVDNPERTYVTRHGIVTHNTGTGSAITVATLQGKKTLCGEPLPEVEMPGTWWVLVQTYKQQVDASQAWILRWLGDHPHRLVNGAKGYVEHIFIATNLCKHGTDEMHKSGFRCSTCSKLVFHCSESPSGIGGKIDGVWADEPPDEDTWREMRRRGRGNRLFYKLITATPIEKKWWHWMPADFQK